MFSQGINQATAGTDQVNAILNLHLATGASASPARRPSRSPASPMRWAGAKSAGFATTLAAHMDFAPENRERVQRFWAAPTIAEKPGLKAVDMFRAIGEGRIKAVWVMATNPAVSMPDANRVRDGARRLPLRRGQRRDRTAPTPAPLRMSVCPPPPGARRTAPSPTATAWSAASARCSRCPARRCPTGGSSRRSRGVWGGKPPSPMIAPPTSGASIAACRPMTNDGEPPVRAARCGAGRQRRL